MNNTIVFVICGVLFAAVLSLLLHAVPGLAVVLMVLAAVAAVVALWRRAARPTDGAATAQAPSAPPVSAAPRSIDEELAAAHDFAAKTPQPPVTTAEVGKPSEEPKQDPSDLPTASDGGDRFGT